MLFRSQPLSAKISDKYAQKYDGEIAGMTEQDIKSQRIGKMFDDLLNDNEPRKINLRRRLGWWWQSIKELFYDIT